MCGRFANRIENLCEWTEILRDWPMEAETGYNIAPTTKVPVVTQQGIKTMRWGLIPSWSKEPAPKYATFNARLESISTKPTFKSAWRNGQTCLIPALGYFEWRHESGLKQPYFVRAKSGAPLVFAGLYEPGQEGELHDTFGSFTIITTEADAAMTKLHPRMPVMVPLGYASAWLTGQSAVIQQFTRPAIKVHAVSTQVNNVRHSDENLIEPVAAKAKNLKFALYLHAKVPPR